MIKRLKDILAKLGVTVPPDAGLDELLALLGSADPAQVSAVSNPRSGSLRVMAAAIDHQLEHSPGDAELLTAKAEVEIMAQIEALEVQAKTERNRRILAELDEVLAKRPWLDREYFQPRALADDTWLEHLRSLPEMEDWMTYDRENNVVRAK